MLPSKSQTSCGVNWKCQRRSPVRASTASSESENRLSPPRGSPLKSGEGLPVVQNTRTGRGIVGAGGPGRRAAVLRGVALPGLGARLAGRRHRVVPPDALAGLDVVGVEEAANAVLAAARSDDREVLDDERRRRRGEALGVRHDLGVPEDLSAAPVERDQVRVERRHQDLVAGDRDAPIHRAAAGAQIRRLLVVVAPEDLAGARVEREQPVVARGHVHHARVHHGRDLELPRRSRRDRPGQAQLAHALRGRGSRAGCGASPRSRRRSAASARDPRTGRAASRT